MPEVIISDDKRVDAVVNSPEVTRAMRLIVVMFEDIGITDYLEFEVQANDSEGKEHEFTVLVQRVNDTTITRKKPIKYFNDQSNGRSEDF